MDHKEASVGDDGLYMTKKRIMMHRILNFALVWGTVSFLLTLLFAALAYFQGQTFIGWELIAYGGNTFNGYYTADLLRIEAALCFVLGILFVVIYQAGFMWLYERRNQKVFLIALFAAIIACVVWEIFLLTISAFDPIALLGILFSSCIILCNKRVEKERKEIDLTV